MPLLERYRALYEYEKDCNSKMLAMLESIPEANRNDPRFQQAVTLADHLSACREKWLDYMVGSGPNPAEWRDAQCDFDTLRPRFAALEARWTDYLSRLEEGQLTQDFEFTEANGERFQLPVGTQIEQLVGHASYHRGQIALLTDQLGGETVDTDYADWWWLHQNKIP